MRLRAVQRKPLSTEEVFKELVSQRLAQVRLNAAYFLNISSFLIKFIIYNSGFSTNNPQ